MQTCTEGRGCIKPARPVQARALTTILLINRNKVSRIQARGTGVTNSSQHAGFMFLSFRHQEISTTKGEVRGSTGTVRSEVTEAAVYSSFYNYP